MNYRLLFNFQAQSEYEDIPTEVTAILEPLMVASESGDGARPARTGAEVAVATLELIDKVKQKKAPEHILITLPVGTCLRLFNLPATHPFAHLNNTFVFVDRPRPSSGHAAPSMSLVPVIEARSGQRFEVPYACVQAVSPSSAPYTLAMTDGTFIFFIDCIHFLTCCQRISGVMSCITIVVSFVSVVCTSVHTNNT